MSSAKWHPASGQFGVFGDVQPGSPEERTAKSQARSGLEALDEYEARVEERRGGVGEYYDEQEALSEKDFALRREGVNISQQRLDTRQATALDQFLGDAYSFRRSSDVQKAIGGRGLYSAESERGINRQQATMSRMMSGQQQGFDLAGQELSNQLQGLDIAQARGLSDLMKSRGVEMSGIEDLLYQIETERISYEGV
tara:strand:- start:1341 stop:1931 length:591 start_codon:yes stop_codon:yes gene_type:complete